jgi:hypothetical protein
MKAIILTALFFTHALFSTPEAVVIADYRCSNGSNGSVMGRGRSVDIAREAARSAARERCAGQLLYVRFVEG